MFAVIKTGGKQYKVAKDDVVIVEKLAAEQGETITLDSVLMLGGDGKTQVGSPTVEGASVAAEVIEQSRAPKIRVFKKKRRKNYRRMHGHRQAQTVLRVTDILTGGKAPAKAAETAEAGESEAKPAAKAKPAGRAQQKAAGQKAATERTKAKATDARKSGTTAKAKPAAGKAKSGGKTGSATKAKSGSTAKSGAAAAGGKGKQAQAKSAKQGSTAKGGGGSKDQGKAKSGSASDKKS